MRRGDDVGRISAIYGMAVILALAVPKVGAAQTADRGFFVGAGIGLGRGEMSVGSESSSSSGLMVLGQVGTTRSGHRRWMLDLTAQLFEVPSPVADERYRAVGCMVRRSFGSTFTLSPGVGLEYRSWSGSRRVEDSDAGLVVGVSVGNSFRVGHNMMLLPELAWRLSSIELEGSVGGSLLSVRLSVLRMVS